MLELSRAVAELVNPPVQIEAMTARREHGLANLLQYWQILILAALTLWLYWPTLVRLVQQWGSDQNFSHGYFVPLFSAFVIWQDRARLAGIQRRPSWTGLALLVAGLSLLIVGQLGAELFLSRSSLLIVLAGSVVLFGGWSLYERSCFPGLSSS